MPTQFELESTLTDRYQTTVPQTVRRALQLKKRDKLHYTIRPSGEVVLTRAVQPADADDPALSAFLQFLAHDIANQPHTLRPMAGDLVAHLQALTRGVEVDLDAPLNPDDA